MIDPNSLTGRAVGALLNFVGERLERFPYLVVIEVPDPATGTAEAVILTNMRDVRAALEAVIRNVHLARTLETLPAPAAEAEA